MLSKIQRFIAKEAVFCVAAGCALLTMLIIPPDMKYLHYIDFRVLCLLLCLMAVVAGMKAVGVFDWLTFQILDKKEYYGQEKSIATMDYYTCRR